MILTVLSLILAFLCLLFVAFIICGVLTGTCEELGVPFDFKMENGEIVPEGFCGVSEETAEAEEELPERSENE